MLGMGGGKVGVWLNTFSVVLWLSHVSHIRQ